MLVFVVALLAICTDAVFGQSALDGFDPNADGSIRVVVVQPDGKILIGGDFTSLSPNGGAAVTRNRIARLNPDGTLDTGFDPNANNSVYSIALQPDGKILVGGAFNGANSIGGQTRNRIARLDPTTGSADSFDPSANGLVTAIALQADGKIVVGGTFQNIGGQPRNYIARLDTSGMADPSFDPHANNIVLALAVQADGKILAGGAFAGPGNSIGGQLRNHIVRLDPATGMADGFDPNASGLVQCLALQADGKILVGGTFSSVGGQTRIRIARLNPATGMADSFDPSANNAVNAIAIQTDGKILVGGLFSGANSVGGQTRNYIARLDPITGLVDPLDPSPSAVIRSIAVQSDGKVVVGGDFTTLASNGGAIVSRSRIARLETDGKVDQTLDLNIVGDYVFATAVQPDGKILIGGFFNTVLGVPRSNIARLNSDGTLDTAFSPGASDEGFSAIAVQADGKILVGGSFSVIGGVERNNIARLNSDGTLDMAFDPNALGSGGIFVPFVSAIAVQADGKILAGGQFNTIGGASRNRIARLDPVTGLADSFNPNASQSVASIAVQPDGKVVVCGTFTSIGGTTRNRIARLDGTTGLADSFNPNATFWVNSVSLQPDGKILAGGEFTGIGGQPRNRIARLDSATGLADSFDPDSNFSVNSIILQADDKILLGGRFTNLIGGQPRSRIARLDSMGLADSFDPNADGEVSGLAVVADGKILTGGYFANVGGQARNRFARLSNDTSARQNLVVAQASVTWERAGSTPKLERVTFESSTDNSNYSLLGNGTAAGNNWTLDGISLPTGENIYIRARGYHRSGKRNGSGSITESVRNVFLTLPPVPSGVVSRKLHGGTPRDVNLPLTVSPGVECRSGGAANAYQVVLTFPSAVTFTGAAVTSGAGVVSGSFGGGTTTVTVNLTGIKNVQTVTVTLTGVSDGTTTGDLSVPMRVMVGDTSGNGTVNASDVAQTKSQLGLAVTNSNFRNDVNATGTVNASDVALVKAAVGTSVP